MIAKISPNDRRRSFQPDNADSWGRDVSDQARQDEKPHARILLVTDQDRSICGLIAGSLVVREDEIKLVDNGRDALAAFSKGRFEMVLIDFAAPGMCGWSLSWSIKADAPQTLIGILTDAQSVGLMRMLLEKSYDLIFLKPDALTESRNVYM